MPPRGRSPASQARHEQATATGAYGPSPKPGRTKSKSPSPPRKRGQTTSVAAGKSKGPAAGKWSSTTVQQSSSKSSARMGRKTTAAQTALKLTRSQLETVIYRWNGIKAFDTNGNYWMTNRVPAATPTQRFLPLYMFDLTSVEQNPTGLDDPLRPLTAYAYPFLQMNQQVATGNVAFTQVDNRTSTGANGGPIWMVEKAPKDTLNTVAQEVPSPLSKAYLKSLSIKMNCWGAKTKSAQYTIQLVKFLDDELVPSHGTFAEDILKATPKRTDFYQNLIKSLTFNPIAQTGGSYKGRMKVLKSETFTIQPNSLDDGDTDPNVRTVSMYVAMNRIISYQESAITLPTAARTNDDASFALQSTSQFKPQTRPKSRVYLLIRCSNYKVDTDDTNVDTPSFDLMIRSNHQVTT